MFPFILALLSLTTVYTHEGCIHDKIVRNQKLIPINDTRPSRLLQTTSTTEYGPIRFHFIYNQTDVDATTSTGQNIMKMMNILKLFW